MLNTIGLWKGQRNAIRGITTARPTLRFPKHDAWAIWSRWINIRSKPLEEVRLTDTQLDKWRYHFKRKSRLAKPTVVQESPRPQSIDLKSYDECKSAWTPAKTNAQAESGHHCVFTIISWNINFPLPHPTARVKAILSHLEAECGDTPTRTTIMLQEVREESLNAIMENKWVQSHFQLSDVTPPEDVHDDLAGDSFIMARIYWSAAHYFTVMLVSKDLPVSSAFRVPFKTKMGRDALVADIQLEDFAGKGSRSDVFRVCTTHLESLYEGRAYRKGQLALISALLKRDAPLGQNVVAGLVAGDLNAIDKSEDEYPRANDVQLEDAWENGPEDMIPILKPFQRDLTNGLARGNTWGYQKLNGRRSGKRMDKILYTGHLDYAPLGHGEQLTRGMRRLGVDLKTSVEAYKPEDEIEHAIRRGHAKIEKGTILVSIEMAKLPASAFVENLTRTTESIWASDHYGLLAQFRLTATRSGGT